MKNSRMQPAKKSYWIITLSLILFFTNCKKDDVIIPQETISEIVQEENRRFEKIIPKETVNTFLVVTVKDENGKTLEGAKVTIESFSATSNEHGKVIFGQINVNANYANIKAEYEGHFTAFKTFAPTEGLNTVALFLMKRNIPKTISATSGGQLSFEDKQIELIFPPDAIVHSNGKPHNGKVNVYARYLNPDQNNLADIIPGELSGLDNDNNIMAMFTYGMINVELEDDAGNPLQIAADNFVTVKMPAKNTDPDKMPIWHFNEKYGLWIEAGEGRKINEQYEFEANHFSLWNLDLAVNPAKLSIILRDQNFKRLKNIAVYLIGDENLWLRMVYTDNNGEFTIYNVPTDESISAIVDLDSCLNATNEAPEFSISPITSDRNETITIDLTEFGYQQQTVYGQLTRCDNQNIEHAYMFLNFYDDVKNLVYVAEGITDNTGHYDVSFNYCSINQLGEIDAYVFAKDFDPILFYTKDTSIVFSGDQTQYNVSFCIADTLNPDSTIIEFNDCLTDAIRTALDNQSDPLTPTLLRTLTSLKTSCVDLSGIEQLENLKELDLSGSSINNITPIGNIEHLEKLSLRNCEYVSNLDVLESLINLKELDLSYADQSSDDVNVMNYSILQNITSLERLNLTGSSPHLENIDFLLGLNNLESLVFSVNKIFERPQQSSTIAQLTWLKELDLSSNSFSNVNQDISFLSTLVGLTKLDLSDNDYLTDLSGLSTLTLLEELNLQQVSRLNNLTGIETLSNLKILNCRNLSRFIFPRLSNIEPLRNLTNLESLDLSLTNGGEISDIDPIKGLLKLKTLSLNQQPITNLTPLSNLIELEELNMYRSSIEDITALSNLNSMVSLNLSQNKISDPSPLCNWSSANNAEINLSDNLLDSQDMQDLQSCLPNVTFTF